MGCRLTVTAGAGGTVLTSELGPAEGFVIIDCSVLVRLMTNLRAFPLDDDHRDAIFVSKRLQFYVHLCTNCLFNVLHPSPLLKAELFITTRFYLYVLFFCNPVLSSFLLLLLCYEEYTS